MRTVAHAAFLAVLALVIAIPALSEESPEEAVRARVKQFEAAYNAGDADAVAAIYAIDGTHTYVFGFTHRGRVEIAEGLRAQFAGPAKGTRMAVTPLHIRPIAPNVAVEEGAFIISGLKDASGADVPPVKGLCLVVYRKDGDEWFITSAQCMIPVPAPQQK